jgi:hypothetical protein
MAGCGIGSVAGMPLGPWLYPSLSEGQGTTDERVRFIYGGMYFGIKLGLVIGAITGVVYALLVRRSRLRKQASADRVR